MTRFFINYYINNDGYLEFKTKEDRDKALKEFQEFESDLNDVDNEEHWLHKAVIYQKEAISCDSEFVADDEKDLL